MSDLAVYPTVRRAPFYEKLSDGRVRCGLCERRCIIPQGSKGFCNISKFLCCMLISALSEGKLI
jgi:hypothetical protein